MRVLVADNKGYMKSILRILIASAVIGTPAGAFAQGGTTSSSADLQRQVAVQEQLIRELLDRLDAQAAATAQLLQRLAALEARQAPALLPDAADTEAGDVDEARDKAIEDRLDAMPKIQGYYDFEFIKEAQPGSFGSFRQHHLSLHLSKEREKFRVFSEIEFEYAPVVSGTDAGAPAVSRGTILVEEAWAEYVRSTWFAVRAGMVLTPNYWNVNHYPNVVHSTRRPLMVRQVFPESFAGVMAYGTKYWGSAGLGYDAYLGNGESGSFAKLDDNEAKAVGGAIKLNVVAGRLVDTVAVAIHGYTDSPAGTRRVRTWGIESQVHKGPFELLFEYARRSAKEDRSGFYVQPSYRLTEKVIAFYRHDRLRSFPAPDTRANTWGINTHPIAPVSFKFEFYRTTPLQQRAFNGIASSLAVAF